MEILIESLVKKYGKSTVLNIPHLAINKGEIVGLLGNNGAGKTTMMRLMLDLLKPDQGKVVFKGIHEASQSADWKNYTGAFLGHDFLIDFFTPEEFFVFSAQLFSISTKAVFERLDYFASFFNGEILKTGKLIRELSDGNKHKVGIVSALLHEPDIIILDEPFSLIDPSSKSKLETILLHYKKNHNATIIISSNIIEPVLNSVNRVILLEKGHLIKDELLDSAIAKEITEYFG